MREVRAFFVCAGLLCLALLLPRPVAAAWPTDPTLNVPLCTTANLRESPTITSDGAGGAIVIWQDYRNGNDFDIYAQRISAAGAVLWTADGVALCTASGDQGGQTITSDGAGGAIVTWRDYRSDSTWDMYAQRISAAGAVLWTADGVALCTTGGDQIDPAIVSDSAGGAVVTWGDYRSGSTWDMYAQRISAAGAVLWTADGVALCTAGGDQWAPASVADGGGGAIVTWYDSRGGNDDIYTQHISADGTVPWTTDGVALCTATGTQNGPTAVSDGAGGAIVAWEDGRSGGSYDIYTQRISAAGEVPWTADGVALCTATNWQASPVITSDGAGGAIVTWYDSRSDNDDIYAQRVSTDGTVQWTTDGVALCTATGTQYIPTITSDGADGAIVIWQDYRDGNDFDIYAQRISAAGTVQWPADGVALCTASGDQGGPTVTSDGAGGVIVAWQDYRNGDDSDIYAQWVRANGELGGDAPVDVPQGGAPLDFALDPVRPNPTRGGALTVRFTLASAAAASLELLDVSGRRIAGREVGSLGAGQHALSLDEGQHLTPGLYLVRLNRGATSRTTRVAVLR